MNNIAFVAKKNDEGVIQKHQKNELFKYNLHVCDGDKKVYIDTSDESPCQSTSSSSSPSNSESDKKNDSDWIVLALIIVSSALILAVVIFLVVKSISKGRTSDYELNR